jgi:hypothetical protein
MIKPLRKWMYHKDCKPKMFTFKNEDEIDELKKTGWCESPAEFNAVEPEPEPEPEPDTDELLEAFNEDPTTLTKDEHIALGKSMGLTLKVSWKEDTMIAKIQEQLDGDDQSAD